MELDTVLRKWSSAKSKIESLNKKIEKYKGIIEKEMKNKNTNKLSAGGYNVTKREMVREYITKNTVPKQIWDQYCVKCRYPAYYLSPLRAKTPRPEDSRHEVNIRKN